MCVRSTFLPRISCRPSHEVMKGNIKLTYKPIGAASSKNWVYYLSKPASR